MLNEQINCAQIVVLNGDVPGKYPDYFVLIWILCAIESQTRGNENMICQMMTPANNQTKFHQTLK